MQEKISHAPPPQIKIVEGKAPPNSWVDENIVKFCQIRSQITFLADVLSYVKELQAEQLSKSRSKALVLKESFASIPEKGSPASISNTAVYNSAQGCIKTQIEYLEHLILIVKQGNPQQNKEMDLLLDQLKQIGQNFPHLTAQQSQTLSEMMDKLLSAAQKMPFNSKRLFWNTQLNMLRSLMSTNGGNIKDFQSEMKELQGHSQTLIHIEELLQNIQNTLKSKPPTQEQFSQLIENLQDLANQGTHLNPAQSQALAHFFQQLNQFKTTKGQNLNQVIADTLVQSKLKAFLKQNPNASPKEIKDFLKNYLQESNLQSSSLPFMHSLGTSIEDLLDKKDFPSTSGYSGIDFAVVENGKSEPNEEFNTQLLNQFMPDSDSLRLLDTSTQNLTASTSDEISSNSIKIESYITTVSKLSDVQNNFGKAAAWSVGQSLITGQPYEKTVEAPAVPAASGKKAESPGSLPWQFQHAILDHYMPGQEQYLQDLAMVLYLDNNGALFGNQLLKDMMGFSGAANTFSFSNSLHTSDGDFSGSMTKAQHQLNQEKTDCQTAINQVQQSLKDIQNQLDSIGKQLNAKPPLSDSQKEILTKQQSSLQTLQQNLKVSGDQLNKLMGVLKSIQVGPPSGKGHTPDKYFNIYGTPGTPDPTANPPTPAPPANWQSDLSSDENSVINGDPNLPDPPGPGGLVNVQSQAQTFQQTYADQGQNQQMILQMHMTEIQQEWTVVSTALQLLNQMYMTLAQGIYGK